MSSQFEKNFMTRMRDILGEEETIYDFPVVPSTGLPTITKEQQTEVQRFIQTDPDDDDDDDDTEEWTPEPTRKKKGKPGPKPKAKAHKNKAYQTKANKQMEDMLLGTKLFLSKGNDN